MISRMRSFFLIILICFVSPLLSFKKKGIMDNRILNTDEADFEDANCMQCIGEHEKIWCSNNEIFSSGVWVNLRTSGRTWSSSYSSVHVQAKYLACPLKGSAWGDQNIEIGYDSTSYSVGLNSLPTDTVWRYKFMVNTKNLSSVKVSLGKSLNYDWHAVA
jgi:hypothetical protein